MTQKKPANRTKKPNGRQRKPPAPPSRFQVWRQRIEELKEFKKFHGHCNVPAVYPPNPSLGHWVLHRRYLRKRGKLDKEQEYRLEELGFCWEIFARRCFRIDWNSMVAALVDFKRQHGHCRVTESQDRDLAIWLNDVRRTKRKGRLDPQRIKQLDRLGVVWEPRRDRWEPLYAALVKYWKQYGHCDVPYNWEDQSLAKWVRWLRYLRRQGRVADSWIERLDKMAFTWSRTLTWEERVAELVEFQKTYGHCRVSTLSKTHRSLGLWVRTQRGKRKQGKLTGKQIQQLDRLGFLWTAPRGRGIEPSA